MDETLIEASTTTTRASHPITHTNHVRFWPSSPSWASLQIRTEGRISDHGSKSWQCYSTADLDVTAAMELYAALGEWIKSQTKPA